MNEMASIEGASAVGPERFTNRELSWLEFNRRVLEEARNENHPLLERLRFLSISGSNLDEFFMVRVAGLKQQQVQGIEERSMDGMTPTQQLNAISKVADQLGAEAQAIWGDLSDALEKAGIDIIHRQELTQRERTYLSNRFDAEILPVLTPQAVDNVNPFPFVPNAGFGLIFNLFDPKSGENIIELLMIPQALPRFFTLPCRGRKKRVIAIESVIREFFDRIFPDFERLEAGAFRVLRDSDIEIEEEAEDLVMTFRSAIKRRRRGRVIRLEMAADTPETLQHIIREGLEADHALIVESAGFIGITDLAGIVEVDRPDLKFEPYSPRFPERIKEYGGDCFAAIKAKDIIVQHPYETFDVVVSFLRQAAEDPDVIAIKQTLYRAGKQSEIIDALAAAAEAGKSVTAVVELKARFDEEQNLLWAARLERAGVQVVYGFFEWKTHAKVSMVVRREGAKMRTYTHWGTGNYHPVTSKIYTDLSYFTASTRAARDAAKLFNLVTGFVQPKGLEMVTMSPSGLRDRIMTLIDREIENSKEGRSAAIWAKMNQLTDEAVIDRLYEASQAGVSIDLVVRGICCLRPGIEGLSENIRVKSIVGRFLEHSRIFVFANGERLPHRKARVLISSADWMQRNFDRRVEYMMPLENPTVHAQVLDQIMIANLIDNEQSWSLNPDGSYDRLQPGKRRFNLHHYFMNNPSLSGRGAALAGKRVPKLKLIQRGG
ncbi:RNA degradosome polyphosphate kinase [Sphingomicrobium marinum]|uniref:RNA degradosome polyphosphate kinase n=1 Tax=Sphingomicrobium marinum TaxID=1227950 RepID=UPI0022402C7E|nr:RNA degradosome polyphosphate kinase [Sphingomicrobium marinum]